MKKYLFSLLLLSLSNWLFAQNFSGGNGDGFDSKTITGATVPTCLGIAGTVGGSKTICSGASTGSLTLSGFTGSIVKWQKRVNSGSWSDIVNTNSTYSEIPSSAGNWDYRAVVLTSGCGEMFSNSSTIIVNPFPDAAGTITGTTTVCQGAGNIIYSVPTITNAISYVWILPTGATGTSTSNSISVNYDASAVSGNITVKGNNTCGNGTISTLGITVNSVTGSAGAISGTATLCQGQNSVSYSVPTIINATSYIWNYSGTGATITGTSNNVTINFSSSATSGNLTVKGTNSCGDGIISANYAITVNTLPSASGAITGTATVCQGLNSVSYSVPVISNATSYNWNYSGTGATITGTSNNVNINFSSSATSGNLTVKGTNSCGDGTISANYAITLNSLPSASGAITGTATVCQGLNSVSYSVPVISNATSYIWNYSGNGATINGMGNSMTINFLNFATSGNLTVKGTNTCGDGTISFNFPITLNSLPDAAGTISGSADVCKGTNNIIYIVPTITNSASYIWTLPNGATGSSTTNSISVNYGTNAVSGNITVKGNNSCGFGTVGSSAIIVSSPTGAAGSITGTSTVCQGQANVSFLVPSIANSTSYIWNYSGTGATINGTGNNVNISFSNAATSGNLTVKGSNSCGEGIISANYPITLNSLPNAAGTISGEETLCQGENSIVYNLPSISNATSYTWTLPNGLTGSSITNSISTNIGINAISGAIKAKGYNECGDGPESALNLTVKDAAFPQIKTKWDDVLICLNVGDSLQQFQWYKNNTLISGATVQFYETNKLSGSYYIVTIDKVGCSNKSNVIDLKGNTKALIYPNPAKEYIEMEIQDEKIGELTIYLINSGGTIVKRYKAPKARNYFHDNLSIQGLSPGTYHVDIKVDGRHLMNYKLVIDK